jgi:hypothetical protein
MRLPGGAGAGDEADHRLGHVLGDELGRFFLGAAADLADHDDAFGLRVVLEPAQRVDEVGAVDRSPPMPMQVDWPRPTSVVCLTAS